MRCGAVCGELREWARVWWKRKKEGRIQGRAGQGKAGQCSEVQLEQQCGLARTRVGGWREERRRIAGCRAESSTFCSCNCRCRCQKETRRIRPQLWWPKWVLEVVVVVSGRAPAEGEQVAAVEQIAIQYEAQ